jgi:hypothetical protein
MFLKAPKGCESCSVAGKEYQILNGVVEVANELHHLLLPHGFIITDAPIPEPPKEDVLKEDPPKGPETPPETDDAKGKKAKGE